MVPWYCQGEISIARFQTLKSNKHVCQDATVPKAEKRECLINNLLDRIKNQEEGGKGS